MELIYTALIKFIPVILPTTALIYCAYRLPFHATPIQPQQKIDKVNLIYITICALTAYTLLALLLSTSWVKGDEWFFISVYENSGITSRLETAFNRYLTWVSRGGEFYGTLIGLSYNRWQNWLLVPLVVVLAPFAFYTMLRVRPTDSIFSPRGTLFYLSILCLCLVGIYIPAWRNYWCYAAAVNYLFPTVFIVWFLSFYRNDAGTQKSRTPKCILLFCLGALSGWGTECMTAIVLPVLTSWVLYNLFSGKNKLSLHSYWGYAGFIFGSYALFGSPALATRGKIVADSLGNRLTGMSEEQLTNFLNNLDSAAVESLRGASGIISLKDIPLLKHIYFIPYISELFISCCIVGLIAFTYLFITTILQKENRMRNVAVSCAFMIMAWGCAFSYLVQCIPGQISFLPPCFIIIAGCGYLMLRIQRIVASAFLAIVLIIGTFLTFIPAGIEAWEYKKYERARHETIIKLKEQGHTEINLPPPYPSRPNDPILLITAQDLQNDPKAYPNSLVADYYKLQSISQAPHTESTPTHHQSLEVKP